MRLPLLPLDTHAHVETEIAGRELQALHAVVFAVTRSPAEWDAALARHDASAAWGIGCHPGVPAAIKAFEPSAFAEGAARASIIGEVGLDGRSKVPMPDQRKVFREVLRYVQKSPLPVSIHSVSASDTVVAMLQEIPVPSAILHWWRGTPTQTRTAVELGCFFSLNGAEARKPKVIDLLPPERVLTETDFPHSRRSDRAATRPGTVDTIEAALETRWGIDRWGVRRQVWANLRTLPDACGTASRMPHEVQAALLTVGVSR